MSAAHTCIRNALSQAFRSPKRSFASALSVPEFLVPALARPLNRPFSASLQRRAKAHPPAQSVPESSHKAGAFSYPLKSSKKPLPSRIAAPEPHISQDIQAWLAAIDPFLPPHLQLHSPVEHHEAQYASAVDFSCILNKAQDYSHDVLSYMGLIQGRWDGVIWIVKKLVEDGPLAVQPPPPLDPFTNVIWPEREFRSLHDLTNNPLVLERARSSRRLILSLNDLTSAPDTIEPKHILLKKALGQVWRSLGNMILKAAEKDEKHEPQTIPHVLEIIAYLHHIGLIPDSVYKNRQPQDDHALGQPPTLHLLSSEILTALSDATWRAHEASVKVAKERMNASYFLGHEIPGSRYKVRVAEVTPELWLELVLWSCLHGGWVLDGTAILERMVSQQTEPHWGVISWQELTQASEQGNFPSSGWWPFGRREETTSHAEARARAQRTISSEVVTGFIDGLINMMRVGVGARGTHPEDLVGHIKNLKQLLDRSALSLGSATWESIMIRLFESGGVVPEKRPELLLSMVTLASSFGSEVSSPNASPRTVSAEVDPPYFFEPSTSSISLLHRTIRSFIEHGDILGAMTTLDTLQLYTDNNKQKSLQQFFEALKTVQLQQDQLFTSRLPPIDFPAFDPQVPVPLLAKLLDLATEAKLFNFGRWLLLSDDLDGPLVTREMYAHPSMAASIIRFGTMAGEKDLVLAVVKKTSIWDSKRQNQRLPNDVFTALLNSQVQLRRWDSVRSMQNYVKENPAYRPQPQLLANFVAELLRHCSYGITKSEKAKAKEEFTGLLFAWEEPILTQMESELYSVLGILSSVSEEWQGFASRFFTFSTRQGVTLSTDNFNQILSGALDGFGSRKGKELVDTWCYKPPKTFEPYQAPGGLPAMPLSRVGKGAENESKPEDIEIVQPSGVKLIFQGRVYPNRQTVWAILRKVQQEEDQRRESGKHLTVRKRAEAQETLQWAAKLLYHLGFDYEDIIRDLGTLAEIAELERPTPENWPDFQS